MLYLNVLQNSVKTDPEMDIHYFVFSFHWHHKLTWVCRTRYLIFCFHLYSRIGTVEFEALAGSHGDSWFC